MIFISFMFGLSVALSVVAAILIRYNLERKNGWMILFNILNLILCASNALYFWVEAVMGVLK